MGRGINKNAGVILPCCEVLWFFFSEKKKFSLVPIFSLKEITLAFE